MKYEIRWYRKTIVYLAGARNHSRWRLEKTRTTRWWWRVQLAHVVKRFLDCWPQPCPPIGVVVTEIRVRVVP